MLDSRSRMPLAVPQALRQCPCRSPLCRSNVRFSPSFCRSARKRRTVNVCQERPSAVCGKLGGPEPLMRPRSATCPGLGGCQSNMRSQIVMASVMPLPSAGACSHVRAHFTEDDPNDPTRSHHASTRCRICLGVSELVPPVDAGRCQGNKGQLHEPWRRILPQRRRVELQGQTCISLVSSQSEAFCSDVGRSVAKLAAGLACSASFRLPELRAQAREGDLGVQPAVHPWSPIAVHLHSSRPEPGEQVGAQTRVYATPRRRRGVGRGPQPSSGVSLISAAP